MALLKENKKTQKELCDFLGVKKSTFTHWKTGETLSFRKYLPEIAAFFNVSIDYLLDNEPKEKTEPVIKDKFSRMFYALDDDDRQEIIDIMQLKLSKAKYKKENAG